MPRLALGSIQIPIQWVLQSFCQVVKQAGNVADHLPSSTVKVQNTTELYSHSLMGVRGMVLNYAQGQLVSVSIIVCTKVWPINVFQTT